MKVRDNKKIIDEIEARGYTLITNVYLIRKIGKEKINAICKNGHNIHSLYYNLIKFNCRECAGNNLKHNYDYIKNKFSDRGYVLLEKEYKNNKQKLKFKCKNGHIEAIRFNDLSSGKGCKECSKTLISNALKHDYQFVKKRFDERGYILISKEYVNVNKKLRFKCKKCNHINHSTFLNFHYNETGCAKCNGVKKFEYEFVSNEFNKRGYKLLSEKYKNYDSLLKFKCPNNHIGEMTFSSFYNRNSECLICSYSNRNNPKSELLIKNYLENNNIKYETQKTFNDLKFKKKLRCDFFIPSKNLIIEFNGKQHYEPIEYFGGEDAFEDTKKRDYIKYKYAKDNGYNLLIIKYSKINKLEEILLENLR